MRNVHVELGSKSYDIVIDRGLLPHVGSRIKTLLPKAEKVAVITDSNVGPLYASLLQESLENAGFSVAMLTFTAGEASSLYPDSYIPSGYGRQQRGRKGCR